MKRPISAISRMLLAPALALTCAALVSWRPLLTGHRGSDIGVENTVEAYEAGAQRGYDALECDVRVTADGHYVICHDDSTRRLGGQLCVAQATLKQLQDETLTQTRHGNTYTGKICTVEQYLDICSRYGLVPIIELKWANGINNNDMSRFDGLLELVCSYRLEERAVFLTSMRNSLEWIRTRHPDLNCQWLAAKKWREHIDWAAQWQLTPSIQRDCFDENDVKALRARGVDIAVWTVDDTRQANELAAWGVKMITTNAILPQEIHEIMR